MADNTDNATDPSYPLSSKSENTNDEVKVGQAPTALKTKIGADSISPETNAIFKKGGIGSLTDAIGNSIYGINHRQTPAAIQHNKDFYGLTFFTRPDMNLTSGNIRDVRQLSPMLSRDPYSIPRIIRCLLDHRLIVSEPDIKTDLMDNQQAFIPMLTNHLLSISGWPDMIAPTMTSQEGAYKESFSMVDGIINNYSTYDITANFRNIPGDPITTLFLYWIHYASNVFQGNMVPYPDNIIENMMDYNTRIYRLVLDSTKSFVKKIGCCGASFPQSTPIGAAFNYEHNTPISDSNHQISIPFRCMGFMAQDDILIKEFNDTTAIFNPSMADDADAIESALWKADEGGTGTDARSRISNYDEIRRGDSYIKLSPNELFVCNNRGYPHINMHTYELGWYLDIDAYDEIMAASAATTTA